MSEMSFDKKLKELEELVKKLEHSDCSLEEALKLFEQGVKLTRILNEQLDSAEAKIEVLLSGSEGQRTVPFKEDKEIARDA